MTTGTAGGTGRHQFYLTHCARADSVLNTVGFGVRASSSSDPALLRAAMEYPAYELPMDLWAKRPARADAPRRLARVRTPDGMMLVHTGYLEKDTMNRDRSYFTHVVLLPDATPAAALESWNSTVWATDYATGRAKDLAAPGGVPAGKGVSDAAVREFLTARELRPGGTLATAVWPDRLKGDLAGRRALVARVLHGVMLATSDVARGRLFIHAEPGLVALLTYAAVRLLPPAVAGDLTFTTFEPAHRGLREFKRAVVVGTFLANPAKGLDPELVTSRAYTVDTFSAARSSPELLAPPPAWVNQLLAQAVGQRKLTKIIHALRPPARLTASDEGAAAESDGEAQGGSRSVQVLAAVCAALLVVGLIGWRTIGRGDRARATAPPDDDQFSAKATADPPEAKDVAEQELARQHRVAVAMTRDLGLEYDALLKAKALPLPPPEARAMELRMQELAQTHADIKAWIAGRSAAERESPAFRQTSSEIAGDEREWKVRRDLIGYFNLAPNGGLPAAGREWFGKVHELYGKLPDAATKTLVRAKVQQFCDKFIPAKLALDHFVLLDKPFRREEVTAHFKQSGPVVLSADPDGVNEVTAPTAPGFHEFRHNQARANPRTTPKSQAALFYLKARSAVTAANGWRTDTVAAVLRMTDEPGTKPHPWDELSLVGGTGEYKVYERLRVVRDAIETYPDLFPPAKP